MSGGAPKRPLEELGAARALRILHRQRLVRSERRHETDTPRHRVERPWADARSERRMR
jgi:hypothetical protein